MDSTKPRNKIFFIRGNFAKRQAQISEFMKDPQWEDAHRYATTDQIIKGLLGRIGNVDYFESK